MNNLSWFLYFADVLPTLLVPFIVASSILTLLWVVGNLICYGGAADYPRNTQGMEAAANRLKSWVTYVLVLIWIVTVLVQSFIPSRETFYLIAGSELGEQVVKTPEAQEIFNDIRKVIKQQIKPVKEVTE